MYLDGSVVECSCAKRETRGSSPGSGLHFSVINVMLCLLNSTVHCYDVLPRYQKQNGRLAIDQSKS